jgi:hypothetical protein
MNFLVTFPRSNSFFQTTCPSSAKHLNSPCMYQFSLVFAFSFFFCRTCNIVTSLDENESVHAYCNINWKDLSIKWNKRSCVKQREPRRAQNMQAVLPARLSIYAREVLLDFLPVWRIKDGFFPGGILLPLRLWFGKLIYQARDNSPWMKQAHTATGCSGSKYSLPAGRGQKGVHTLAGVKVWSLIIATSQAFLQWSEVL